MIRFIALNAIYVCNTDKYGLNIILVNHLISKNVKYIYCV